LSDTDELLLLLVIAFLGLNLLFFGIFGTSSNIVLIVLISSEMVAVFWSLSENYVASVLTEVALCNQGAALVVMLSSLAHGGVCGDN
jgi:hypothetical protein